MDLIVPGSKCVKGHFNLCPHSEKIVCISHIYLVISFLKNSFSGILAMWHHLSMETAILSTILVLTNMLLFLPEVENNMVKLTLTFLNLKTLVLNYSMKEK